MPVQPEQGPGDSGDTQYPVFSKAPLYIRRTLMFPYDEGQKLQHAIYLREGKSAFAKLFLQPPVSSSQVLHPDRYVNGISGAVPDLPKRAAGTSSLVTGTVGELDHRILLRQYIDRATADLLAPQLKGGAYRIEEARAGGRLTLTYVSDWQTAEAASLYFAAYGKVLRRKWKKVQPRTETATEFAGCSEDGCFCVTLAGTKVLSREGAAGPL